MNFISSPLYVYFVIHIRAATYTHSPLEFYELVNKRKIKLVRGKCKENEEGREKGEQEGEKEEDEWYKIVDPSNSIWNSLNMTLISKDNCCILLLLLLFLNHKFIRQIREVHERGQEREIRSQIIIATEGEKWFSF